MIRARPARVFAAVVATALNLAPNALPSHLPCVSPLLQLNQMRQFILLEAKEKADEIRTKAKADADLEKQTQVLNAKTKLADDYDKKEKAAALELRM